jgi:hypothetical protein|tara:strand:+ start:242 stop:733 length:492 start_codon:yes stop_codon:yes gene_type:complete
MKIIKKILLVSVLSIFFIGPSFAADKAVGYFGWHAYGKYIQMGEKMGFWRGEFSGSFDSDDGEGGLFHKASMRCPGSNTMNFETGTTSAQGVCLIKDMDGDEAYVTWVVKGKLGQANPGSFTYSGGTGKYEGMSGDGGTIIGHIVTNWTDGDASGYALWNRMK